MRSIALQHPGPGIPCATPTRAQVDVEDLLADLPTEEDGGHHAVALLQHLQTVEFSAAEVRRGGGKSVFAWKASNGVEHLSKGRSG